MNCETGNWNERELRDECDRREDWYALLTCEMSFPYVTDLEIRVIREFGGYEKDIAEGDVNHLTRLAAYIRECVNYEPEVPDLGDERSWLMSQMYPLDEDGNYCEGAF